MGRRQYETDITINGRRLTSVSIDTHYESKHFKSINDGIILRLVSQLDGRFFDFERQEDTFRYFMTDKILLDNKLYRLVWLLEIDRKYIGVINAYRRD